MLRTATSHAPHGSIDPWKDKAVAEQEEAVPAHSAKEMLELDVTKAPDVL